MLENNLPLRDRSFGDDEFEFRELGLSHSNLSSLSALSNVSVRSSSSFMNDLKKIEQIVEHVPLLLDDREEYQLHLGKNGLLVIQSKEGIEDYSIAPDSSPLLRVASTSQGTLLSFDIGGEEQRVLLAKEGFGKSLPSSSSSSYSSDYREPVRRTTSPWRPSDYYSQYEGPSESQNGGGGGER